MKYRELYYESAEELHQLALNADSHFAVMIAENSGTSSETLHYLVRKDTFNWPVIVRNQQKNELQDRIKSTQKKVWVAAVYNPALNDEDLTWIYEQLTNPERNKVPEGVMPGTLSPIDINILKGIWMHPNATFNLVNTIQEMKIEGKSLIVEDDFIIKKKRESYNSRQQFIRCRIMGLRSKKDNTK